MTETQTKATKAKATPATPPEDREPTQRVVIRKETVIVLPEDITPEKVAAAAKALGIKSGATAEAWCVVGEFAGASKEDAIEAHAGKPGTPDAIPGTYKAPTVRAFAGGARYKAPPKPLVERELID